MAVNLVNLENVHLALGTTTLLDGVSLGVGVGDRIGIVGRNGGGKSTLLRVLTGALTPDGGRVTRQSGLRMGVLTQSDTLDPAATVRHAVLGDRDEHTWAGEPRVRQVLTGLELGGSLDRLIGPMSGGERRRVALAALLVTDAIEGLDLLVLDEPTNHLDVEGVDWLAHWLTGSATAGAQLIVTHDRWFLDAVTERTWEVTEGQVYPYEGGYAAYVLARAERDRQESVVEGRRQNLLRKELAWLRRGPPARTSKPQFRIDAANALIADEPPARDSVALRSFAGARLGKDVYDIEHVTLEAGSKRLLTDVTWRLGPGDRIGVVGVNGSGKSTLLRLLEGDITPAAGTVKRGQTVQAAMLDQEVKGLPLNLRVLEAVTEIRDTVDLGNGRTRTAGQLLEDFGFGSAKQWTPVSRLSGGERRRLQLLRLLLGGPNVLLLDEPTNDLDIDTLTALEDVLDGWPGTLIVVSHDRYFLERVADTTVALLGDGTLRDLPGGVDEYLRRRRQAGPGAGATLDTGGASAAPARGGAAEARAAAKEQSRIERAMEKLDARAQKLHAQLAEHSTDYAKVAELDTQLRAVTAEKTELEDRWLELADLG